MNTPNGPPPSTYAAYVTVDNSSRPTAQHRSRFITDVDLFELKKCLFTRPKKKITQGQTTVGVLIQTRQIYFFVKFNIFYLLHWSIKKIH